MYNKKWKKAVAIIAMTGILAGVPGISGYAQEVEQNLIGETNISSAESNEDSRQEDSQAIPDEDIDVANESTSNIQESEAIDTQSSLSGGEMDAEAANEMTPSEAEKNDMANSWRFKNGERIIQDSPAPKARSARAITPWTNINGVFYNSIGQVIEGVVAKGIDVSQWNGNVDWSTVKNTDVDYAIIRCGYGMDQTNQDDPKWKQNADACTANDIPFGVYIYSYADTVERAISEAQHVLRLVKGYKLTYPIYYDLEETSVRNSVSKSGIAKIAKAFCDTIEAAGYRVGIYANTDWFTNYLTDPVFNNWTRWVAQWNYECTYAGAYKMWQCTDNGRVNGIAGAVDLNMDFGTVDNKRLVVKDGKTYCYSGSTQLVGEQKVNGRWYFFDESNGGAMKTGWHDFENKRVYYRDNGTMVYGEQKIDDKWYYFKPGNGAMQTGIVELPAKKVCYGSDGAMLYGEQKVGEDWYYFKPGNGAMQTGLVLIEEDTVKFYTPDGKRAYGEQKIGDKWYYFSREAEGIMQTGFVDLPEKRVYYGSNGTMVYGEQKINNSWYYFKPGNGAMQTGLVDLISKTVYYDDDGKMVYGEKEIGGFPYYFKPGNGALQTGWRSYLGQKYYYTRVGIVTGEQFIDGRWYFFDKSNGAMQTGFVELPGKTVYYNTDGAMVYGEQKIGDKWYYFKPGNGAMQTGFVELSGKTVYYNTDGTMVYGEFNIGGEWYAFKEGSGEMIKNAYYNGYYYGSDGVRQKNEVRDSI